MTSLHADVSLNGGTVDVTINEDTDGDGTAENTETVSVSDGSTSTVLSNIEGKSDADYWLDVALSGDPSPEVYVIELEVLENIFLSGTGASSGTGTGVIKVYHDLVGSAATTGSSTGVLHAYRTLSGSAPSVVTGSGALYAHRYITGSASSASPSTASVKRILAQHGLPTWRMHLEGEHYPIAVAGIDSENPTLTVGTEITTELYFFPRSNAIDYQWHYARLKDYMDTAGDDLLQYGVSHSGIPWFRERDTAHVPVDSYLVGFEADGGIVDCEGWWGLLTGVEDASEVGSAGGLKQVTATWFVLAPFSEYGSHSEVRADLS